MAMIAPIKDWIFKVVPVSRSMSNTPQSTAGIVRTIVSANLNDWKFAAKSRKMIATAKC